ncbi:MAG: YncE family protein, partial [Solirubrobacterales bacterium]
TKVGANPKGVALARGLLWVANTDDGTVSIIDSATNSVAGTVDVGGTPRGVTAAFGSVWVANGDGYVTQVDPKEQEVAATVELQAPASPEEIAADDEELWVSTGAGDSVVRVQP